MKRRCRSAAHVLKPMIPVRLEGPRGFARPYALLDSGADASLVPLSIAEHLGLHLSTGREAVRGIGGPIGVRRGIVDIVFRGLDEFHRLAHVPCLVAVDGWAPVILGRERVFDAFRIDFRMRENRILLTRVAA